MRPLRFVLSLVVLLLLLPAGLQAEEGFARISLVQGEVQIRGGDDPDWLPAAINTPLAEGDSVWCPPGARAEIQLRNGARLRLDDRSALDVVEVAADFQQFYLAMGRLYLKAGKLEGDRLQVDVGDAAVVTADRTRLRIDLAEDGDADIAILKGSAYVESLRGRTRVRSGEMLAMNEGGAELAPLKPPDEWQRWNEQRDRKQPGKGESSRYLPPELAVYGDDLDSAGEWVTVADYGTVWRPTVNIGASWAPYRTGRWAWRGGAYVWISFEPWGWGPYHYGRWSHHARWGWCWVPPLRGDVYWSPGYVAWVDQPNQIGWVPLAPGEIYYGYGHYGRHSVDLRRVEITTVNRPVNVYRNVSVGNAVTVVTRDSFGSGRFRQVQVRGTPFAKESVPVGVPPRVRPASREARMPAVRTIPSTMQPPAAVKPRPVQELQQRHPRVREYTVGPERPADRQQRPGAGPATAPGSQPGVPGAGAKPGTGPPAAVPGIPVKQEKQQKQERTLETPPREQHQPSVPPTAVRPGSPAAPATPAGGVPPGQARGPERPGSLPPGQQVAPVMGPGEGKPGRGERQYREGKPQKAWKVEPRNQRKEQHKEEKKEERKQQE
jgi:hypothetical protein